MPYTIEEHKHRFSAWAAGRAANVIGCRFSVAQAKLILEVAGLKQLLVNPNNLPLPHDIDPRHREWRTNVIAAANGQELNFTHGVAAKLINIYLKAGFVCGGHHTDARVKHYTLRLIACCWLSCWPKMLVDYAALGMRRGEFVGQISILNNMKPLSITFASQCRIRRFGKSSSIGEVTNSDVERGWAMKPPCPFL